VVLIPGIGGSVLADAGGRTVYDVNASKGVARVLDPAALAVDNELRATRPISSYGIAFKQLVTGYEHLWAALVQGLGLSQAETAVAGERLVRPNASLLAFPYDFRQSVSHTAELLDRELRRRAQGRPVVLVAHSMGGLVAAWWWAFLSDGIEVKEIVLGRLKGTHADSLTDGYRIEGAESRILADDVVQVLYTLCTPSRVTRRSTLYRCRDSTWQAVFHQGTVVEGATG